MSTSVASLNSVSLSREQVIAKPASGVSWFVWAGILAITSSTIGGAWDVSWHRSIGRDSFLTPAHIAIYACGVIAAVICSYLIFATTFGRNQQLKDVSVNVLGFRAPLGAFIAAWGGIATLTSAPFDNWWHNAYGLDVKIVSPPHTLLILGLRGVGVGVLFLVMAAMNRAETAGETKLHRSYQLILLYLAGLTVNGQMFFLLESTWDGVLHRPTAYIVMGIALPIMFALFSRATGSRWACTVAASIYLAFAIAEMLIFPLFPATPKLGPVYFPVTHLVPMKFPVLLVVPALALDLLWQRTRSWKMWQVAAVSGVLFIAVLVAVEWPFANFLMSKWADNRFFGSMYFDYSSRSDRPDRLRQFIDPTYGWPLFSGLFWASVYASVSAWLGLKLGQWMRGIQR